MEIQLIMNEDEIKILKEIIIKYKEIRHRNNLGDYSLREKSLMDKMLNCTKF